jgi:TonB family protein
MHDFHLRTPTTTPRAGRTALALLACGALVACAAPATTAERAPALAPAPAPKIELVGPGGCALPVTSPVLANRDEVQRLAAAAYPASVRGRGRWSESVLLRIRVLADGTVEPGSASVDTARFEALGEAARTVAPGMRFQPATVGGAAVPAWRRQYVTFVDTTQAAPFEGTAQMTYTEQPVLRNGAELAPEARRDGPPAVAFLRLRLDESGAVNPSVFVEMATDTAVEEPAREIARRMRFTPAEINGFRARSAVAIPIYFGCMAPGATERG